MRGLLYLSVLTSIVTTALAGCSGTTTLLTTSSTPQVVTSPGYPNLYNGDNPCMWRVSRGQNYVMHVTVKEFGPDGGDTCMDTLEIIAVLPEGIRKSIGIWCGGRYGQTVEIAGDVIIQFHPAVGSQSKFHLEIKDIGRQLCNNGSETQLIATEKPMYLYSPFYPHIPENSSFNCRWKIIPVRSSDTIYLEAIHFEMSIRRLVALPSKNKLIVRSGADTKTLKDTDKFLIEGNGDSMKLDLSVNTIVEGPFDTGSVPGMALRYYSAAPGVVTEPSPGSVINLTAYSLPRVIDIRGSQFSNGLYELKIRADAVDAVVVLETMYWKFVDCNPNVTVYDGNSTSGTPVFSYCSSDVFSHGPQIFRSSGREMVLTAWVETPVNDDRGFTYKYYSRHKFDLDMGSLMADNTPAFVFLHVQHNSSSRPGQGFKVTSKIDPDKCVKLEIVGTNFQTIPDLHFAQVLRVFDGDNSTADELGTCTDVSSSSVTSSGMHMYVEGRQGATPALQGLWIKLLVVDDCPPNDKILPSTNDQAELPHIPPDFPLVTPVTCRWRIPYTSGRIKVDTLGLDLGYQGNNDQCHDGHIRAYDGYGKDRFKLTTWCTSSQTPLVSRSNVDMTLVYRSSNLEKDNYTISYQQVEDEDLQGFGGHLPYATSAVSYFRSPNYPGFYPNNLKTDWRLSVGKGYENVELVVMVMDTEGSYGNCDGFDVLWIYDGKTKTDDLLDSLCGTHLDGHKMKSSGKDIFMEFQSNNAMVLKGFVIAYTAIKDKVTSVCGSELLIGEIVTSVVIKQVESNKSCVVSLRATPFHSIIKLEVIREQTISQNCTPGHVHVRDGKHLQAPVLVKWGCENRLKFESSGPDLIVEIEQTPQVSFELRYYSLLANQNCLPGWVEDIRSEAIAKTFSGPQISVRYTSMSECKWRLRSESESEFVSLNLTSDGNIVGMQVRVYDGFDDQSELLTTWSGDKSEILQSSGQFVYITANLKSFKTSFTVDFMSQVKPISSTPMPEISTTACNNQISTVTNKVETTTKNTDPPTSPTIPICTCPTPKPCPQNAIECSTATGGLHGHTTLIIGGSLAGFSLLSLLIISSLILIRHNRVQQRYTLSHKAASQHGQLPKVGPAFDEPYPEIFDPNDPRLNDEGDLGICQSISARSKRRDPNPRYELSLQKDLVLNTAL